MLKNILKLDGAQQLSKIEQKSIKGGITQECANMVSEGCQLNISAQTCASTGGFYSTKCRCCSYL